ncbi:MAG: fibronectin/fibrinogen-binding protein [Chloracidobacterium sp.]|nr:fibronectin/fibrinogen-binding protein [Chloracidobacterium sp.]MCO5333624.1 NFACT RNA binding domain-containing protein [Pyrinomonadaceae bacterium]
MPDTQDRTDNSILREQAEKLAAQPKRRLANRIKRLNRLLANLNGDLARYGDPAVSKRYGELILASLRTAVRDGDVIRLADLYDEGQPEISIEGDRNKTLSEIAEAYFKRYAKARSAVKVVNERRTAAEAERSEAEAKLAQIGSAVDALDMEFLSGLEAQPPKQRPASKKTKAELAYRGVRRFISSDGFEIWVGKKAADNDHLTFRIAKSLDVWLHAADHPGSHVVIRDSGRKQLPERTLREAAELAAFYSDARGQTKAAVRHTQRKFVNKPKKAAPGMVSLSGFKTILVEPKVAVKQKE